MVSARGSKKVRFLFRTDLDDYTAPMGANNAPCLDVCSRYVIDPTMMWIKRQIHEKFRSSSHDMGCHSFYCHSLGRKISLGENGLQDVPITLLLLAPYDILCQYKYFVLYVLACKPLYFLYHDNISIEQLRRNYQFQLYISQHH